MTHAETTLAYWESKYAADVARGRNRWEFGMRWMLYQIDVWKEEVRKEHESK